MIRPVLLLFGFTLAVVLSACSDPDHKSGSEDQGQIVTWPITDQVDKPGYIVGTTMSTIRSKLAERIAQKDQFETTKQFQLRQLKLMQSDTVAGLDISKHYLFTSLADWKYDADSQTLHVSADFSDYSQTDLGSYEGSNAFGAKVNVKSAVIASTNQHFFKAGERPCYCYIGNGAQPLDSANRTRQCEEDGSSIPREFDIKMSPERAKALPKYIQVLTVESFDTRALLRDPPHDLCLMRTVVATMSPTISNPNDQITMTTDINARLLRIIIRNDETGDVLKDQSFSAETSSK
jgi:hypothetical protein